MNLASTTTDAPKTSKAYLRVRVFNTILAAWGATCDEVEQSTGLTHQTASARVHELKKLGFIVDSGEKRATRSGRKAIVWRAA